MKLTSTWRATRLCYFLVATIHYNTFHSKKRFLTWTWPLTYDLDLRTWPRYSPIWPSIQNSGPYVCPFIRESETHTLTDRAKTITPHVSLTLSIKMYLVGYSLQSKIIILLNILPEHFRTSSWRWWKMSLSWHRTWLEPRQLYGNTALLYSGIYN